MVFWLFLVQISYLWLKVISLNGLLIIFFRFINLLDLVILKKGYLIDSFNWGTLATDVRLVDFFDRLKKICRFLLIFWSFILNLYILLCKLSQLCHILRRIDNWLWFSSFIYVSLIRLLILLYLLHFNLWNELILIIFHFILLSR